MTHPPDQRECFDAALIPGMRGRLAEAYGRFRAREAEVIKATAPPAAGGSSGAYRQRDCPCCGVGSAGVVPVLRAHGMDLLDCPGCGLTYTRQVMDEVADAARYASSELDREAMRLRGGGPYLELESARDRYYLMQLMAGGFPPGRMLEVGCGTGTLILEAQSCGWQALGIEPGQAAARVAQERGAQVVHGWFPADLPADARKHDAVAVLDVLEHFAAPLAFLAELRACLGPGGRLLVQVPNWDSPLVRLQGAASSVVAPGHWSYFTSVTLTALLARAGFRPLRVETVVSELDRIAAFPAADVQACIGRLRPGLVVPQGPLTAAWLHAHGLGYKLIGVFALPEVH
ncbi:MAG TPA: class I SAM-dependent methyltransferase [Acetobacteraceae bacterium]|nr:class I SAM-dependent methyltransferase [Acetobacteraceae bacterium]